MVYLLQTEIPNRKPLSVSLRSVFGLGKIKAQHVITFFGITERSSISDLSPVLRGKLVTFIEKHMSINEDLKQSLVSIKESQERLKTYKGQRSRFKLPRRGQRTHTNAKTSKKLNKY
ncbi:MAG: 30S ribosomal protein S13 [SAR324 cluster bacterium]|uniref:30S ribosomal protein S13 n=1 Tax=SAR324 cluster bacterium TaxID=2024889 RepID=A0A2A4SM63_9DELT|nr:MAG: 30S ribosomal protein S13 [SAR324 cluster bacterium]